MSDNLTQEDIDRTMTEGKFRLLLPEFMLQLRSTHRPWTFRRAHVNDFSKLGNVDHGRTLTARATQVTPTRFMLERNMDPISNNDIYLVLTQDEGEERDGVVSCWSEDDGNWFLDEARRDFPKVNFCMT